MTTEHSRRYGAAHQRLRKLWAPKVERGEVACARCHRPIYPGQRWHLDHDDHDPTQYLGPSHVKCNLSTWHRLTPAQQARSAYGRGWANVNARRGARKPARQPKATTPGRAFHSRDW
jgi:hypothetical protein